ncbi:unnamed protein product [Rotaria socialis]
MATKLPTTKESRNFEDLVTCKICLKHFVDPRLLPCSHTYCFGCICKAASYTNGDFMCPLKDGTTVQQNQINSLRLNHAMAEVVKMVFDDYKQNNNPPSNSGGDRQRFKENMILVSGLPLDISEEHLLDKLWKVFSTVGNIKINQETKGASIDLFRKIDNKPPLNGTATITFEREESVVKAIEKYNGKCVPILNNNQIYVKKSEVTTGGNYATGLVHPSPNSTELKVWVKIEKRLARKEEFTCTIDIDDLKKRVFKEQNDRDLYEAYYRNQPLGPGERVPSGTTSDQPIVLRNIKPQPPEPGGPSPVTPKPVSAPEPFVSTDYHIIVDCSNIFIGSQTIRDPTTGATQKNPAIRVNVKNLVRVVENDKLKIYIKTRIAGGSKPPENLPVWKEWASCGYKCIVIERSEDGVDEMLHAQILQLLHIYKDTQTRSQVLVLVTGDGNINGGRTSFLQSVESVLTSNWSVELWSWERSLSQHFLSTQRFFPSRMTIKYLDSYRNDITFIQKPREN